MMRIRAIGVILVIVGLMAALTLPSRSAWADATKDRITAVLQDAKQRGCATPTDLLDTVLCAGKIRIGVRANYPGFGYLDNGRYTGFEIDLANRIAERLNVTPQLSTVTPANRILKVVAGEVDIDIATMTHTVTRDQQIRFVRPHYFASHTSIMGPRRLALDGIQGLAGRSVCVPVGAASNIVMSKAQARLMLYDTPQALIDALRFGTCSLAAHDNTLWAASLADQRFAQRFEEKVALADSGWGIGIRKENSRDLEHVLSLIILDFYRSGVLAELLAQYPLPQSFITAQTAMWSQPACLTPAGDPAASCMLPSYSDVDVPTAFVPQVRRIEAMAKEQLGLTVSFPMLTGQVNFEMFLHGIVNTLILVVGAISVTLFFAVLFQAGLRRGSVLFGTIAKLLTAFFRSSPVILLMLLGYYLVSSVTTYGPGVALCTAILAIGLTNGCFAGVAIADASASMDDAAGTQPPPLVTVLHRARTQITAFMVNAARASAVAAFIGTPELLNTLNDIASVSSERTTTFAILLLFYMAIIWAVARLSGLLGHLLTRQGAAS